MRKSYIYACITVLMWSTLAAVVKILLKEIPGFQALSVSSVLAFIFLLIINIFNGSIKEMKSYRLKDYFMIAGLGFIGLFMYSALYYYGISQLSSQEACILNYLWPIMIVLFACIILKEKFTGKKIIAMLLSFFGIVVLSVGNTSASSGNRLTGIAACVTAAVCYGLFSVLNKKHNLNQGVTMMWIWFVTALCSAVMSLFFETIAPINFYGWLGMIWLGIVINALAYLLWAIALKKAGDSAKIANLAYLVPFLSIIISFIVLKERVSLNAAAALVLIISGILLQSINKKGVK